MSEQNQNVDTSSAECKEENWKAGNELGHELKDEGEKKEPMSETLLDESETPLFMKDGLGGNQGNSQDEKDETEE